MNRFYHTGFKLLNGKERLTAFLFMYLCFCSHFSYAQNYTYRDFLSDQVLNKKLYRYAQHNLIDSLKLALPLSKNRLGFKYFQYKAQVANDVADSLQYKYLDTAFMRGMTPLCIKTHLHKFDSARVYASFKKNYLKAYNPRLINVIDSMNYAVQDSWHRVEAVKKENSKPKPDKKNGKDELSKTTLIHNDPAKEIAGLRKQQTLTDSLNFSLLNHFIERYGWPGANKVGEYYCQRSAPLVSNLVVNLGTNKRGYQIETLEKVIALCEKQQESWQTAESLILNLHRGFRRDFSGFSFLKIVGGRLDTEGSYFSMYMMAEQLVKHPSEKIELKCSNKTLFDDLQKEMLVISESISFEESDLNFFESVGLPKPAKLDAGSFLFIESPELAEDSVVYRISKK